MIQMYIYEFSQKKIAEMNQTSQQAISDMIQKAKQRVKKNYNKNNK